MVTDSLDRFTACETFNILMSCLMTNFITQEISKKEAIHHIQCSLDSFPLDEWETIVDENIIFRKKIEKQNEENI